MQVRPTDYNLNVPETYNGLTHFYPLHEYRSSSLDHGFLISYFLFLILVFFFFSFLILYANCQPATSYAGSSKRTLSFF